MLVIARYHEIALKGRNRPFFVDKLARNLRRATEDLGGKVQILAGRVGIEVPDETPWETARERIASVFGIANFSRTRAVPLDMAALAEGVVESLREQTFGSFRISSRRSYKSFPLNSGDIDSFRSRVMRSVRTGMPSASSLAPCS
jgi:thiamine biosynthesis protein ThiI